MNMVVDEIPNISVVTKIEVLGFKMAPEDYLLMKDFVDSSNATYWISMMRLSVKP